MSAGTAILLTLETGNTIVWFKFDPATDITKHIVTIWLQYNNLAIDKTLTRF